MRPPRHLCRNDPRREDLLYLRCSPTPTQPCSRSNWRNSEIVWRYQGGCHHHLAVADDGTILVLAREAHVVPRINPDHAVLEDFLVTLDPEGRELERISLLEALERSPYAPVMASSRMGDRGDLFHANSVQILDGTLADEIPAFERGNILTSFRRLDTIAVLDPRRGETTWTLQGMWLGQHQPTLLAGGDILLFDNWGRAGESQVIQFDPVTQEIAWRFTGDGEHPFYTGSGGACHRLPNGNTLITESDNGRALEVTPAGEVVWDYRNPERAGREGELVATLFDVVRLPPDFPVGWLDPR